MGRGTRGLGLMVMLALSACGGGSPDPLPSESPVATPSAIATTSPTAAPSSRPSAASTVAPTPPDEAAERTAVGVQAFARYFLEIVNHAYATGSTARLKELSAQECKTCANWLANIDLVYGEGGSIRGSQVRVLGSSAAAPGETAQVKVDALVSAQTELDVEGRTVKTYPEEKGLLVLTLEWVDDGWQVSEVRLGGPA